MDYVSTISSKINELNKKVDSYLKEPFEVAPADFKMQQNGVFIADEYNRVVVAYSDLLKLITETQYLISQSKKCITLMTCNTTLERNNKIKLENGIKLIETISEPLHNEKERLKTVEMFYRNLYNRFGM